MKTSKQIGFAVIVILFVLGAYQHGKLDAYSATNAPKIGVVNVTKTRASCTPDGDLMGIVPEKRRRPVSHFELVYWGGV